MSAKLLGTSGLTAGYNDAELARQIRKSVPGMAHFAATGPFGTCCKDCKHFGCWKQIRNKRGDVVKTVFLRRSCGKFHELTAQFGDPIPPTTESCRYFQRP
jgi:hypothetical protein